MNRVVQPIEWTSAGVVMIDQTRLPREERFVTCKTYEEVADASRSMVILLEWAGEAPPVRQSFRYLERLLKSKGVATARAALPTEDRLEALVAGIALGDHVSLFLADRGRVDPYPVEAIGRLKASIGNPGERPSASRSRSSA